MFDVTIRRKDGMTFVRLSDFETARIAKGVTHQVTSVTTRHAEMNDVLIAAMSQPEGQKVRSLTDSDGIRQFILGVDSLDSSNVRIGVPE